MAQQKYLCIQRSASSEAPCKEPSPAEMEQMYARFNAWRERFADNIVDLGGKLGRAGSVVRSDSVTDGPFVEAKEVVGGFMIIAADTLEQAIEVARESPGVHPGSSVELRPITTP